MADPRRSTTRPQRRPRTWRQRANQWPLAGFFSMMIVASRPGVRAKSGAVRALATMVKRVPGTSSVRVLIKPDDSTASPIRLAVLNRIGKGLAAMVGLL